MLLGRKREQADLIRLLETARRGLSGVLVVRGEAGIGKTALLEEAIDTFAEIQVTRISGFEAEEGLSFAGLQRLLVPWKAGQETLPEPQRTALESAFGQTSGPPPDRFLVGLASLTMLAAAASIEGPLLCVVDDAQWVDFESLEVLSFVARRLYAEGVVLLFGVREPVLHPFPLDGLPNLELQGLKESSSRELLATTSTAPLDSRVISRIVDETGGNPLAIKELVGDFDSDTLLAGRFLPEVLPVQSRLESHFLRQVRELPPGAQTLVLVASVQSGGDPDLVCRVAMQLGASADDLAAAEASSVLRMRPNVTFRHPLIPSAVYSAARDVDRRSIHAAIADAIDGTREPDRRAWHRGMATYLHDEDVATELEISAERARRSGGSVAVAKFLTLSAELTPNQADRARRYLQAAEVTLSAGWPTRAQVLLDRSLEHLEGALMRARALRLEGMLRSVTEPGDVPIELLSAARAVRSLDPQMTRDTLLDALEATFVSAQLTRKTNRAEIAEEALAASAIVGPEATIDDLMLQGLGMRFAAGFAAAVPWFQRAIEKLRIADLQTADLARFAFSGVYNAASDMWDADGCRQMLRRLEGMQRERGNLDGLRITLVSHADCQMWAGNFSRAESHHSEAVDISVALGDDTGTWEALKVELLAWQGREEETRRAVGLLTGPLIAALGAGGVVNLARKAVVVLELGLCHYEDAVTPAKQLFDDDPLPTGNHALSDLVEAGLRGGDQVAAERALARLEERALVSHTPWAMGLLARSRALMAVDEQAEELYGDAIERLRHTYIKTDLARAHLVYGEWLRRQNRRVDARLALRTAHDMFATMGAVAFAERSRRELLATGERVRKRTPEAGNDLTPQEEQIARLAAQRATNLEIATQMFISEATVAYHLRNVFRKLEVTSRRELASKVASLVTAD